MSSRLCSFAAKEGVFTPEECDRIRELATALDLQEAQTHDDDKGRQHDIRGRNCLIQWVHRKNSDDWRWVFDRITENGLELNKKYWGFDCNRSEKIQYTSYGMGNFYAAHFDNGSSETEHRKLSISVQLTPPSEYWGGKLKFWSMNEPKFAPASQGAMCVFPSYLLHVAKPVWKGRREVLVTWLDGKKKLR
jgi:predicted 2-oxoglutarate/Fe(II)-dependent dioxygenase YbiX